MGKVGAPHQTGDVDLVTQLDADAVELKAPIEILADVFAGRAFHRFQSKQAIGPVMVAVITDVGALQEERNPANLILGEKDTQSRKSIEEP